MKITKAISSLVLLSVVTAAHLLGTNLISTAAWAVVPQLVQFPGKDGVLEGWLYLPTQAGRHPGVVAMHGCSGLTDKNARPSPRHEEWGQSLAAQGFIVLFPDSYGSRGLEAQCRNGDRDVKPSGKRVDDAKAGLHYLAERPDVKLDAISLMGWSDGGSTVLYTVEPKHAPKSKPDFAKAVAFYPGCRVPQESGNWQTRMPLMVLIGDIDDWTPLAPCQYLVAAAKQQGASADLVVYHGAYHDFDHPNEPIHLQTGLAFTANQDGRAHTGTNLAARADALLRVPAYLAR